MYNTDVVMTIHRMEHWVNTDHIYVCLDSTMAKASDSMAGVQPFDSC